MKLVERALQLHALESALNEAQNGEGCVALVCGEAGIGKTSLVEHFTEENEKSWRIVSGGCDLLFTPRPLGPLGDIALQTGGRLLHLLDSAAERGALFSACLSELKSRPTVLVIEDIHWADEATLDLLKYLGRRIRQTACLMILTYRDDEIGTDSALQLLLGDLASSRAVHRVPVSALSVEGVRELARDRNLDPAALHRLTNGNPFFLTEVMAGEGGIPPSVRDAMLARAARLSPAARQALEAAAVAGLHVEAWLLAAMSGADGTGVEECISRGMLQSQGDGYAFRHELARQAILERVSVNRKRELNRRALAALRACPESRDDLARLASHAEGTGDAEAVLEYAPAAARQAASAGAHRQAAALYELALRFAVSLPAAQHAQMLEAYADERWFVGRSEAVISIRREIIEKYRVLGDRSREGVNLAMLAIEFHALGRSVESEQAIDASITMLEALPPSAELARACRAKCVLLEERLDYVGAVAEGEKVIALAERLGEMDILARTCNLTGYPMLLMGDERGHELLKRSLALAREYHLDYATALALGNWISALVGTFQFEEAGRLLEEGIAFTAAHDDERHLGDLLDVQAEIQLYQGHWREATDRLNVALQHPDLEMNRRIQDLVNLGRIGVRRGDVDAWHQLEEALALSVQVNFLEADGAARAALAEASWLKADHQQAMEQARVVYDQAADLHLPWFLGQLAFWRWRAGDVFTAPEWIATPYALQIAGDWRGAAREWEIRGCPYEQGMALMDGDEAAQLAALEIFERLGARPIIERLKQKMRADGIRGIPRGRRASTRGNAFGLTAREMEILCCVFNGSSNLLIAEQLSLSVRTVEHHVTSMLKKTDTRSRSELIALALREHLPLVGQASPSSPQS